MKLRFPMLGIPALVLALAAPGAFAKDNGKGKGKDKEKQKKAKVEGVADDDDRRGRKGGDDRHDDDRDRDGKMTVCHIPPGNSAARHTITVSEAAWQAHRNHGDHRGTCGDRDDDDNDGRGEAFRRLDRNNDGRVSRGEWPYGETSFDRLDLDDDGALTPEEHRRRR
jgi:EF hand